jgi:hypothetical protein
MVVRAVFISLRLAAVLFVAVHLSACSKKSGEAIVEDKEHIDAGDPIVTPTPGASVATAEASPGASPRESANETHEAPPLAEDEIVVDTYVMKKSVRGTSKDPRAYAGLEQWRVNVTIIGVGGATIRATRRQYEKLKIGDRVKVRYKEGNYTGTIWSAEIVE